MKRTCLKRKKPMRRVSKKRAIQNRQYTILRQQFLYTHPVCKLALGKATDVRPAHCTIHATDIHHRAGRNGSRLNDITRFVALCRNCHEHLHQNPKEAEKLGLIIRDYA